MDYRENVTYDPLLVRRCWAAFLDYLFFFGLVFVYVYLTGEVQEDGTYAVHGFSHLLLILFIWIVYFPGIEGGVGYTLFKGLFDLKVLRESKRDYPFVVSFKRHMLDPIDFAFFGIIGIIMVKVRSDHKRLGDIFARSRVILDKETASIPSSEDPDGVQTAYNTQNNVVSTKAK
jgi:uncharacterized RDD family membrane protein YckC